MTTIFGVNIVRIILYVYYFIKKALYFIHFGDVHKLRHPPHLPKIRRTYLINEMKLIQGLRKSFIVGSGGACEH